MTTSFRGRELINDINAVSVPKGAVALWWLGQASFAIRVGDATIYIDPFLTDSDRRLMPPPCAGSDVTNAELILLTHGHGDHLDVGALPLITAASPLATIIAPRPLVGRVAELIGSRNPIVPADAGRVLSVRDLKIMPVRAMHEAFDKDPQLGYPYLGYVLYNQHIGLYHAGDTILFDGLVDTLAQLPIDLALLPINGRDYFRQQRGIAGNMDYREAAELASLLNVDSVMPIHYGMFAGNTASPGAYLEHLQHLAPHIHTLVPGLGQSYLYHAPRRRHGEGAVP